MTRHFPANRSKPAETVEQHADLQERAQQGVNASRLLDFASDVVLPDQEKSIRKRIFAIIDDPEQALDPLLAAQSWIELRAAHKLVERLRKMKTGGEAAGLKLRGSPINTEVVQ